MNAEQITKIRAEIESWERQYEEDPWDVMPVPEWLHAVLDALEEARGRIAVLEDKIETHHLLSKGWHDVENFYLEEEVDESGQSYGRCMTCGMPWQIVRPGKGQPTCECEEG